MYRVVIDRRRPRLWHSEAESYVEDVGADAATPGTAIALPPRCPHCGGLATTTRSLSILRTRRAGFLASGPAFLVIEVPSCARMPRPLPAYFGQIALVFATVVAGLAILLTPFAAIVAAVGIAANVALWRARTWIYLRSDHDDAVVLDVRDPAYAHGVARLNRGRVDGGGGAAPPPAGDERRAPLPPARIRD